MGKAPKTGPALYSRFRGPPYLAKRLENHLDPCSDRHDEAPTRARLRQLLATHADIEVCAEAGSGPEAVQMACELHPDAMFLDIQLPGCTGIDVAASLPSLAAVSSSARLTISMLWRPSNSTLWITCSNPSAAPGWRRRWNICDCYRRQASARNRSTARFADIHRRPGASSGPPGGRYLVVPESRVLYFGSEGSLTRLVGEDGEYWMDPSLNNSSSGSAHAASSVFPAPRSSI